MPRFWHIAKTAHSLPGDCLGNPLLIPPCPPPSPRPNPWGLGVGISVFRIKQFRKGVANIQPRFQNLGTRTRYAPLYIVLCLKSKQIGIVSLHRRKPPCTLNRMPLFASRAPSRMSLLKRRVVDMEGWVQKKEYPTPWSTLALALSSFVIIKSRMWS